MRPNTIWPLSLNITKLPGMKLLFIFGNVEYKRNRKILKAQVQVVFETRRHSRSQESSPPAPPPTQQILKKTTKKTKAQYNKDQTTQEQHLPRIIIPRNRHMTSTRIQTANQAGHEYNVTLWLLYTDMFIVPVIKTCLYFIK